MGNHGRKPPFSCRPHVRRSQITGGFPKATALGSTSGRPGASGRAFRRCGEGTGEIDPGLGVIGSGVHEVQFRDAQGKDQHATLSIRHATMTVRPPIGKQKQYRHQELQIIYAEEINPPQGRAPVFWKLITNLPVETH